MRWQRYLELAYPEPIRTEYSQKNIIHKIHRWIGLYLGYFLYHLGMSGNMIDILRILISAVALYMISFLLAGDKLWPMIGAFLLYGQNLLDAADGSVARARNELTKIGAELDQIVNESSMGAILILIGVLTQNMAVAIINIFSVFILLVLRKRTGSELPLGLGFSVIKAGYRFFLFIQTMLFIIPFILALVNIFNSPAVSSVNYIISFFYLFLAVLWLALCLLFKRN